MKNKLITWILFVLIILNLVTSHVSAYNSDDLSLYARAAVLMDAENGRILYGKNQNEVLPMASTTKIMTCIVALEYGNLEDIVAVTDYAASMPKVKLGMKKGDYYKLGDLLYSLMLESHNDTAVAIAQHIGSEISKEDSLQAFIDLMNQKARDIGCTDTFFVTPNGLDATYTIQQDDGTNTELVHSTTAFELAKIMRYCTLISSMKEEFLKITQKRDATIYKYKKNEDDTFSSYGNPITCHNHNALLDSMEGAMTGKTGYTAKAGYCYVAAIMKNNHVYIVALLACGWPSHKGYKWSDTRELIAYGTKMYTYKKFNDVNLMTQIPKTINVYHSVSSGIYGFETIEILVTSPSLGQIDGMLLGEDEKLNITINCPQKLDAPTKTGEIIGNIQYTLDGKCYNIKYLTITDTTQAIHYKWCLARLWEMFIWKK